MAKTQWNKDLQNLIQITQKYGCIIDKEKQSENIEEEDYFSSKIKILAHFLFWKEDTYSSINTEDEKQINYKDNSTCPYLEFEEIKTKEEGYQKSPQKNINILENQGKENYFN